MASELDSTSRRSPVLVMSTISEVPPVPARADAGQDRRARFGRQEKVYAVLANQLVSRVAEQRQEERGWPRG